MMQTVKVFLASSLELKEDRQRFEQLINRQNTLWQPKNVFLKLFICEEGFDALSQTRSQDEYNKEIRESDIFVMLFYNKVGKFSEEEFDTALAQFRATQKPSIFTYFKNIPSAISGENRQALQSLWAFQDRLKGLQHYTAVYENIEGLQLDFKRQLEELVNRGVIVLNSTAEEVTPSLFMPILDTSIQRHRAAIHRYTLFSIILMIMGILVALFFNFFMDSDIPNTVKLLGNAGGLFIATMSLVPYSQIHLVKGKLAFCEGVKPKLEKMNKEELKIVGDYIFPDINRLFGKSR